MKKKKKTKQNKGAGCVVEKLAIYKLDWPSAITLLSKGECNFGNESVDLVSQNEKGGKFSRKNVKRKFEVEEIELQHFKLLELL